MTAVVIGKIVNAALTAQQIVLASIVSLLLVFFALYISREI